MITLRADDQLNHQMNNLNNNRYYTPGIEADNTSREEQPRKTEELFKATEWYLNLKNQTPSHRPIKP